VELEIFSARRFRNLTELQVPFLAGMNVIYGENAHGKTNLLEGIYILSTLRSFRTKNLFEALQFGSSGALLQGFVRTGGTKHSLSVALEKDSRHAALDGKNADTLHYLGGLNVFLFSYPLLEVIRGGPEDRRRFVDRAIAMSRPSYLPVLLQYHRALKQKNALLTSLQQREAKRTETENGIRAFNQQLLDHGLEIVNHRKNYLVRLQELLREKQRLFFEREIVLGLELSSSFLRTREEVEQKLEENLEREIAIGVSVFGVHRDEIKMTFDGRELRKYGSSGQHRAFLLLLLLAQLELYERLREDRPVLLLDDLDSELDEEKIQAFLREIAGKYQTIISTSRRELFTAASNVRMYRINSGRILEM
jgi:DNA replication and repair protein RecF